MSTPKLTPEQDARICAEYGVTPGEWRGNEDFGYIETDETLIADTSVLDFTGANTRLMAASKPMLALLEQHVRIGEKLLYIVESGGVTRKEAERLGLLEQFTTGGSQQVVRMVTEEFQSSDRDIRALLDGLRGGEKCPECGEIVTDITGAGMCLRCWADDGLRGGE